MAKNEIIVFNPLTNPLHLTQSVGPTKTFFEKMKKRPGIPLFRFKICKQNHASIKPLTCSAPE